MLLTSYALNLEYKVVATETVATIPSVRVVAATNIRRSVDCGK
jgi:hypothetical protein